MKFPDEPYDPTPQDPWALLAPFLSVEPTWLILAGLGNCDEYRPARRRWPNLQIVGVDPNPQAIEHQRNQHGWAEQHPLLTVALSDTVGESPIYYCDICSSSMHPRKLREGKPSELTTTPTTTLDILHQQYGFSNCLLWLDLEGYEYHALRGGRQLLSSGEVQLITLEVWYDTEQETRSISGLLETMNYRRVWIWFRQHWGHNEVWMKREQP